MNSTPTIAPLPSRAVLRLSGRDAPSFLQNLISQDMADAMLGTPIFSALLTPQGKYLFDFFVLPEGDSYLLDVEDERKKDLVSLLGRYHIRGDVSMRVEPDYGVFAAWDGALSHKNAFTDPRLAALGQRLVVKKAEAPKTNAEEKEYRELRYKWGVAEGGHEITVGNATLLEVNFDALNGVDFEKGCYMGQELTARMHHRALVKKRYLPFRFEGSPPKKLTRVLHGGFEIAEVFAVGEEYGIGLFHLEHLKPVLADGGRMVHAGVMYDALVPDYLSRFITR